MVEGRLVLKALRLLDVGEGVGEARDAVLANVGSNSRCW